MPLTDSQSEYKSERLEARISPQQKRLFKRAAELQGNTLTEFVVVSLQTAADKIIRDHNLIELAGRDRDVFVAAILKPDLPSGRLKKAVSRYKKLKR